MPVDCPICSKPLIEGASACAVCGFPVALAPDARHLAEEPELAPTSSERGGRRASSILRPAIAARDPQAELCHRLAGEVRSQLALVRELGEDTSEGASDMRQAALTQADGRVSEALSLLRGTLARAQAKTRDLCARRLDELEHRQTVLTDDGVGADFSVAFGKIRERFDANDRTGAIDLLRSTESDLVRVESDWRGLKGLLGQIDQLRTAIKAAGKAIPEVESDVAQVRAMLGLSPVGVATLDSAAQTAARALMLLHEALPPLVEAELAEHAKILGAYPTDHPPSRRARALHGETARHLRRGRLTEATVSLRELREVLKSIPPPEPEPAPPATIVEPARTIPAVDDRPISAPPADAAPATLERLLHRARELAARVRSLPHDSEVAFEAAAEIRRATELLRSRKLDEAERTLTRLMMTLSAEPLVEG
ncbi:MAG: hypothetical protein L3K15_08625 [Thermoplasmata archaeon]|nr:hypothetical protein [Thermoplasmata archaeon]